MREDFLFTALTADPETICAADDAGVDRIGIDIEHLGKHTRQGHMQDWRFAAHRLDDLRVVRKHVRRAKVFARLNPLHRGSSVEVQQALDLGAQVLMLPYFTDPRDVEAFAGLVAGRAEFIPLVETAAALDRIAGIVSIPGLREVMIGLNDLQLSLGLASPFAAVVSDRMGDAAECVHGAGLRFGFGGLARVDDRSLPVHPDLVVAQYPRLGASAAWLSRSFFRGIGAHQVQPALDALRGRLRYWSAQPPSALLEQRRSLALAIG